MLSSETPLREAAEEIMRLCGFGKEVRWHSSAIDRATGHSTKLWEEAFLATSKNFGAAGKGRPVSTVFT